ncbi:MAG: phospholipid/cholesterol/gamma-HCH transport system substrate-binding protein, partial [Mycobacterium sp.]|nr:phospholipid/cholesterol/gamma-HCH transport system substrate-binding protein [Mycobacterium sp.]
MKSFSERNPLIICAVGVGLTIAVVVGALNYKLLPFFNTNNHYSAYFAEAGGLIPGAAVQVRGFRVGQVDSLDLDDVGVLINFNVSKDIHLGDRTEATIKTKSLLGAKTLEVIPRGNGRQDGPIPIDRT